MDGEVIGKFSFNPSNNTPIVHGKYGQVRKGKFENQVSVAITQVLKTDFDVDIGKMNMYNMHPNIWHYYVFEENNYFCKF